VMTRIETKSMVISLALRFGSPSQARTNTGQKRSGISAKL
jgi:hypothetical protein